MWSLRPTRRWLRFSLRTILIVVTALCIWIAWHVQRAERQKKAVEAVHAYGGWVYYDFQNCNSDTGQCDAQALSPVPRWLIDTFGVDMFHAVEAVNLDFNHYSGKRLTNENQSESIIPELASFPSLRVLYLHGAQVTDQNISHISQVSRLERLVIRDATKLSDAGVAHLADLKRLKVLHITNASLGDQSLAVLGRLSSLQDLNIHGNTFTDDSMVHLHGLKQLRSLGISCGRFGKLTDAGMAQLAKVRTLEFLGVWGHRISDDGVRLLTGLPRLRVLNIGYSEGRITDEGVRCLAELEHLERLYLVSRDITSEGFGQLSKLKNLKSLRIGPNIDSNHSLYNDLPQCVISTARLPFWME